MVYFCPLNHKNNHFTLLEINDRDEVIRYYDSMSTQNAIDGSRRTTRVGALIQVHILMRKGCLFLTLL